MDNFETLSFEIMIIIDLVIIFCSLTVIIIVLVNRRRTETFIISIPILLFMYGTLCAIDFVWLLEWDVPQVFADEFSTQFVGSISNYCLALVYWVFAF